MLWSERIFFFLMGVGGTPLHSSEITLKQATVKRCQQNHGSLWRGGSQQSWQWGGEGAGAGGSPPGARWREWLISAQLVSALSFTSCQGSRIQSSGCCCWCWTGRRCWGRDIDGEDKEGKSLVPDNAAPSTPGATGAHPNWFNSVPSGGAFSFVGRKADFKIGWLKLFFLEELDNSKPIIGKLGRERIQ